MKKRFLNMALAVGMAFAVSTAAAEPALAGDFAAYWEGKYGTPQNLDRSGR
jgi:hypothetical protein